MWNKDGQTKMTNEMVEEKLAIVPGSNIPPIDSRSRVSTGLFTNVHFQITFQNSGSTERRRCLGISIFSKHLCASPGAGCFWVSYRSLCVPTSYYLPLLLSRHHHNFMGINVTIWSLSNPGPFSSPQPSSDLLTVKT